MGDFIPTLHKTDAVEVAVKKYRSGERESKHYHKVATEITVVVNGVVEMNQKRFKEGDIIIMEPGEATDFLCVEDSVTTVVKIPGAKNDKYEVSP